MVAVPKLRPTPNEDILNLIKGHSSSAYQERVPDATKANIAEVLATLTQPDTRHLWNEFTDALMNRIGRVVGRSKTWQNPMAEFKLEAMQHGTMIEEYKVGLIKAKSYDGDREHLEGELFGRHEVDIQSSFHVRNRRDVYAITINQAQLRGAFLQPMGLTNFVNDILAAPATSDQWDEFLAMCALFAEYEKNGGFHKVQIPNVRAIVSGGAEAKQALRVMRGLAGALKFPSTKYNAARMPSWASPDELVIFTTPEFEAALDVEALAGAFNIDRAKLAGRIITIPQEEMGIAGCQAIITTKDFFVVADTNYEMASQWNPRLLHNNYFLHHWQIISASRFVPAIMLTDLPVADVEVVQAPVTGISSIVVADRDGTEVTEVQRGELYNVLAKAITDGDNDAVRLNLSNPTSSRTNVTNDGVLTVGGDEGAATLTITATATWLDPENIRRPGLSKDYEVSVSGDAFKVWPAPLPEGVGAMSLAKTDDGSQGVDDGTYSSLTAAELAELLGERGLATSGTKPEKVARLREADTAAELTATSE